VVCANSGRIDPERIEDYIESGGYATLHHVLFEMQPAQVTDAVLRGVCVGVNYEANRRREASLLGTYSQKFRSAY
jgi:hypothetical protein